MPELQPGGFYSGYLTMASGMGQNLDRMARLRQFLNDAPQEQELRQSQIDAQRMQNQYAPTMMQARMQGSPWEREQAAVARQQFQENLAMQQQNQKRQQDILQNTLRHQTVTEQNQTTNSQRMIELEKLKVKQTAWKNAMDAYQAGMGPHPSQLPEFQGMSPSGGMQQAQPQDQQAQAPQSPAIPAMPGQFPQAGGREIGGIPQNPKTLPIPEDLAQLPPGPRLKIIAARVEERPHANAALNEALANLDRMSDQAVAIAENPRLPTATGLTGTVARNIPGMAEKTINAQLESLKAQTAFATLNQLRSQSKTGGALGQVSNQEENMLANSIAGLDPQQNADDFRKALQQLKGYTKGAKDRLVRAYKATYGVEPDLKDYHTVVGAKDKAAEVAKDAEKKVKFLGFE